VHTKAHAPLYVALRPSRLGAIAAGVVHVLAAVAALDAPSPWLAAGLLVVVALSAWSATRGWLRRAGSRTVRAFARDGAGRWWVEAGADPVEAELAAPPVVTGPLVALALRAGGACWNLVLLPDSADPDALRRLRAVLRTRT
jgi:hypothetical protein